VVRLDAPGEHKEISFSMTEFLRHPSGQYVDAKNGIPLKRGEQRVFQWTSATAPRVVVLHTDSHESDGCQWFCVHRRLNVVVDPHDSWIGVTNVSEVPQSGVVTFTTQHAIQSEDGTVPLFLTTSYWYSVALE
jgi:hypothetical protein